MKKLNWQALRNNRCPKCNKDIMKGVVIFGGLMSHPCGLTITKGQYKDIVTRMNRQRLNETSQILQEDGTTKDGELD